VDATVAIADRIADQAPQFGHGFTLSLNVSATRTNVFALRQVSRTPHRIIWLLVEEQAVPVPAQGLKDRLAS
jgi:hypothetical protein